MKRVVNALLFGCVYATLAAVPSPEASTATHRNASGANFGTVLAAAGMAFVSGTIKDTHTGVPVVGALVTLLEAQPRGKEIKSFKTDSAGRFTTGIVPGTYRLRAVAEGFMPTFTRINLDRPGNQTFHLKLKRTDTLVQKRGDSDDYRWIGTSVPRSVLHFDEASDSHDDRDTTSAAVNALRAGFQQRPQLRGMVQMLAVNGTGSPSQPRNDFFGTNFALASTLGGVEMALIGQRGVGQFAPQRLSAIATLRPRNNHQVTASIGYGQVALTQPLGATAQRLAATTNLRQPTAATTSAAAILTPVFAGNPHVKGQTLDQVSIAAIDEWQVAQPLLIIYGFDYSRFVSASTSQQESVLPRFAVQYTPNAQWRMSAALTPGATRGRTTLEGLQTESLNASFETQAAETALLGAPLLDRSRRYELGLERLFADGAASLEASAFYDIISGHGVGVLALPLEAAPDAERAMQQVAHQVTAMNGAARGARLMTARRLGEYATVSAGYSVGYGSRFNHGLLQQVAMQRLTPAQVFNRSFFQVASAKVDLDFTHKTGTRLSTVIRLAPAAVVFAIDPFAGRMGVYDPNINFYLTQELPTFGLPLQWQALVDVRNLLNQSLGLEDGGGLIAAARSQRSVRGGIAFRW